MPLHLLLRSILNALQALPDDEPGKAARVHFIERLTEEVKVLDSLGTLTRFFLVDGSIQLPLSDISIGGINGECLLITVNTKAERPQILHAGTPAPSISAEGIKDAASQIRDFIATGLRATEAQIAVDESHRWLRRSYRGNPAETLQQQGDANIERAMNWNASVTQANL